MKMKQGFFMRAENFLNFSNYIDNLAIDDPSIYE
jgi:predicted ATPase